MKLLLTVNILFHSATMHFIHLNILSKYALELFIRVFMQVRYS